MIYVQFAGSAYPDILVFSKSGSTESGLGRYKKMAGTISNNRPVWEHEAGNSFVFSTGTNWMVGPDWKGTRALFYTALQESIPNHGWQSWDEKGGWQEDPLLRVDGGHSFS